MQEVESIAKLAVRYRYFAVTLKKYCAIDIATEIVLQYCIARYYNAIL